MFLADAVQAARRRLHESAGPRLTPAELKCMKSAAVELRSLADAMERCAAAADARQERRELLAR